MNQGLIGVMKSKIYFQPLIALKKNPMLEIAFSYKRELYHLFKLCSFCGGYGKTITMQRYYQQFK